MAQSAAIHQLRKFSDLHSPEQLEATKKLNGLADGASRILLDIKAVFPFDLFPDQVTIDETKVTIHSRYFFFTKEVRSIELKDIFNVSVSQGVLFSKLEITDRFFSQEPFTVEYLWKSDAEKARRIIQGLIIAKKENVDVHDLPMEEVVSKVDRIGKSG